MAPSDDTPPPESPPEPDAPLSVDPRPSRDWRERIPAWVPRNADFLKAPGVALAIGALVVGFGGGYVTAKGLGMIGSGSAALSNGGTPGASLWSMFGKPRDANAPRRGIPRPHAHAHSRSGAGPH